MLQKFAFHKPTVLRAILTLFLVLGLTGCAGTPQVQPIPPVTTTAPNVQPAPSETAAPTATTAPTVEPTLAPTEAPTEVPTPAPAQVITKANLSGLSEQTLPAPEPILAYIWPGPETPLPAPQPSPYPDLLLASGPNLHPVKLDPPGIGQPLPLPLNGTQPLAYSPTGAGVVVKDPTRTAFFRLDGPIVRELFAPTNSYSASFSRDGRFLVVTSADTWEANLYDLTADPASNPIKLTGFETAAPVYDVTIVPGGKTIAWHARANLQFQDVATGQMGTRLEYQDFIGNISYSPDGSKMALDVGGQLYLYSLPDATLIKQIPLASPLSSLDWSPDGTRIAGGSNSGLEIWDGANLIH